MRALSFVLSIGSLVGLAALAACGSTMGDDPGDGPSVPPRNPGDPAAANGLPCAVDEVLANNCRKCHSASPQFGAPMPLVTLDDLHAPAKSDPSKKVYELIPIRIANDADPMPPPPNARLSAADRKILTDFAAAGAPESTEGCGGDGGVGPGTDPGSSPTSCTPDMTLAPTSPWTMPAETGDVYVCYGVDLTRPTPTHITAFAPAIDNTKIVHHVVLYESDVSYSTTPQACSPGASVQWRMVMGWAPGGKALELPPEAGFPIKTEGATHYVVQIHYSNPQGLAGETDSSGFSFCTAPPRKYAADVMAFGSQSFTIQPGVYSTSCSVTVPAPLAGVHLVAALPHMHKLGTKMSTTLTPAAGGAPVDLGTDDSFSFDSQAWVPVSATTAPGDVITTTCQWTNNTGGPVGFGSDTADEMCYSFTLYYPKIELPQWSWALPALTSTCQ